MSWVTAWGLASVAWEDRVRCDRAVITAATHKGIRVRPSRVEALWRAERRLARATRRWEEAQERERFSAVEYADEMIVAVQGMQRRAAASAAVRSARRRQRRKG